MIGTVSREETNLRSQPVQNAPQGKYEYNPNVPSFDARISREQDMYSLFASSSAVKPQEPRPLQNDLSRQEALWERLNQNTASYVNTNAPTAYTPNQTYRARPMCDDRMNIQMNMPTFEPMRLREPTQARRITTSVNKQQIKRRKQQVSKQGKVILAVYLAVVLLIATLIIVNSEVIDEGAKVEAPSASVQNLYEVNEKGLAFVESPYTSSAETNWFDELCDKLSK